MSSVVPLVPLGEITRISKGKKPKSLSLNAIDDTYLPYILIESFGSQYNQFTNDKTCRLVCESDIEIVWDGERAGLVSKGHKGYLGSTLASVSLTHESFDSEFIFYILQEKQKYLRQGAEGTGVPHLSRWVVENLSIYKLPLPEQKKIASILTSVDEVIENTQKQIDKLQDLKKATMNELLTKGIGHTEFKDSELGRIPKSWEVVRFQEVFESYTYGPRFSSKDYSPIGNVKTIRGTDLTKDWCINYKQVPLAELDEKVVLQHRLKENDVVMITTADCGFSAVFKEQSIPFIASAYAIRLRPTLRINSSFCVCYLQTSIAKNQIEKYERKGTVSNLPGSDVMNVRLPLPSLDEQSEIVSALTSIDTNISNNLEKLSQTQSLKKSLMQDLLTGKVRVTVN